MERLITFDIDKTLVKNNVGHESFSRAFKEIYGVDATIEEINYNGMTDKQIIIEILKNRGLAEENIIPKLEDAVDVMIKYYVEIEDQITVEILDGVVKLIKALDEKGYTLGLVTGNLEPNGRMKMRIAGLNNYFPVGGFGSDDISRTELVKLARKRAEEKYNFKHNKPNIHFGDAPQDVMAAKNAAAIGIGVATGIYTKEELENAGAAYVLDDLSDTEYILKLIKGI